MFSSTREAFSNDTAYSGAILEDPHGLSQLCPCMLDSHVTVDDVEVLDEKRDAWMISREDDGMIRSNSPVGAAVDSSANS